MTTQEKRKLRYFIVANDRSNIFDFEKGFYEMDSYDLIRLDKYAEIFNIKSDNYGRSRARVLWNELQKSYKMYNL